MLRELLLQTAHIDLQKAIHHERRATIVYQKGVMARKCRSRKFKNIASIQNRIK